ncbi:LOW QUALITY PROTEIN: hypothetical protein PHPALM_31225 [Phytophthora palmivora]|uniref:Uncharacterized protein n=1 Tax=Phytophthora palmivora TaxID=4796 RepID=A0A2P4X359_9STRA|nr:LOW QUALITY PROTEIN: hypothetical protein PHPALM_31225 [Phytophthora palmivora]
MSPTIENIWPHPNPGFTSWYAAVVRTSDYVATRMSMASRKRGLRMESRETGTNPVVDFNSVAVYLKNLSRGRVLRCSRQYSLKSDSGFAT